jgi:methyl-accepting chemotaxis protein
MAARDAEVIEASGEQQFVGIDQLAQAMASIDHAMSQSMSGAQQLESEAAKLEELGERLRELVEFHR